jgi:hypothetical protein
MRIERTGRTTRTANRPATTTRADTGKTTTIPELKDIQDATPASNSPGEVTTPAGLHGTSGEKAPLPGGKKMSDKDED